MSRCARDRLFDAGPDVENEAILIDGARQPVTTPTIETTN